MLSSDRLRTTHADDHEETDDLWERLRSEANRRSSMIPAAPSQPPPARLSDYRDAFDSEPPEEDLGDSDLPPSPYETAQRFVSSSYPPAQPHYQQYDLQEQQSYGEADQLAQYEAEHSTVEQYGEQYDDDDSEQTEQFDSEAPEQEAYEQEEYEAQQYAAQQYDLQSLAPQQPQYGQDQYGQDQYGQQQFGQQEALRSSNPPAAFGQQYGQPAAYGHVQPQAAGFAQTAQGFAPPAQQQWAHQPAAMPLDNDDAVRPSRWTKPLIALGAVLAIGAAGYQFVLVPRQQAARAASLVELQQRQAALIEQQEKEQKEAAAKAEAEQKAANEAALARADEAAAAAAATAAAQPAVAKADRKSRSSSSDDSEERDRKKAERAERHAARAAAKAEKGEARATKAEKAAPVASSKPSKKKAESGGMSEADSDDPLLGL